MRIHVRPDLEEDDSSDQERSNELSNKSSDEPKPRIGSKDTPETLCMSHDYESPAQAQWSLCIVQQENRQLRTELEQSRQHGEEASNARMRGNAAHKVELDALKNSLADSEAKGEDLKTQLANSKAKGDKLNTRLAEAEGLADHLKEVCIAEIEKGVAFAEKQHAQTSELFDKLSDRQRLICDLKFEHEEQAEELAGAKAQIDELSKELVKMNTDRDACVEVLAGVKAKIDELIAEGKAAFQKLIDDHEEERDAQAEELAEAKVKIGELDKELAKANADHQKLVAELAKAKAGFQKLVAEFQTLDDALMRKSKEPDAQLAVGNEQALGLSGVGRVAAVSPVDLAPIVQSNLGLSSVG